MCAEPTGRCCRTWAGRVRYVWMIFASLSLLDDDLDHVTENVLLYSKV